MAKKKQVEVISDPPALDLEPTLVVDGTTYNINAATAGKVVNSITIESTEKDQTVVFDGAEAKTIKVMSPDGGDFNGPITVPSHNYPSEKTFNDNDVLNFTDTVNVLLNNINNSTVVYKWEKEEETEEANYKLVTSSTTNSINSISIVEGQEADANKFAEHNYNNYQNYLGYMSNNENKRPDITNHPECFYMPVYFYIGGEDNLVYYGTALSPEANLLNINTTKLVARAEKADKLTNATWLTVDLAHGGYVKFDGSKPENHPSAVVNLGIQGTLGVANGGTGKQSHTLNAVLIGQDGNPIDEVITKNGAFYAQADNATPKFDTLPVTCGGTGQTWHTQNAVLLGNSLSTLKEVPTKSGAFYATSENGAPQFGTLQPAQGGTGATNLTNVTVGNANNLGGKAASTYQSKILTGKVDPNTSTDTKFTSAADGTIYIMYT